MFSLLKRGLGLLYSSPTRLFRFALNNSLRPYLKDEVQQESFELGISQGVVNIENLELNEKVLNKKLNGAVPFYIVSASIGKFSMGLSWRNIAADNSVKMVVENVRVHVRLGEDPNKDEVTELEYSIQQALAKSLQSSIILSKEDEEEEHPSSNDDDDLGIQSVETLFENFFQGLSVSVQNLIITVHNIKGEKLNVTVGNIDFANSAVGKTSAGVNPKQMQAHTDSKLVTFSNLKVNVIDKQKGDEECIVHIKNKNSVTINYAMDEADNLVDLQVDTEVTEGIMQTTVSSTQLSFLRNFVDTPPKPALQPELSESELDMDPYESEYREPPLYPKLPKEDDNEDLNDLGQSLYKSILQIGPYSAVQSHPHSQSASQSSGKAGSKKPCNVNINFRVKQTNLVLYGLLQTRKQEMFGLDIADIQITYATTSQSLQIMADNLVLSHLINGENKLMVKTVSQDPKGTKSRPPKLHCTLDLSSSGPQTTNLQINLQPIVVMWDPTSFQALIELATYYEVPPEPQPEEDDLDNSLYFSAVEKQPKTRTTPSLFTIQCPSLHILFTFPSTGPKDPLVVVDVEAKQLQLKNHPSDADSTMWQVEFDSLTGFLGQGAKEQGRPNLFKIYTDDNDDKPRLEIRLQENINLFDRNRHPIPTMIIDLQSAFEAPRLFSYYSPEFVKFFPNAPPTVDLESIKMTSNSIIDVVFPCLQIKLRKSEYGALDKLLSLFAGESTSSSTFMLSIGKVNATITDDTGKDELPIISSALDNTIKFTFEIEELRVFQAVLFRKNTSASFMYINTKDAKVLDSDNAVLIRQTPRQLRMDEAYCPPFAFTVRKLTGNLSNQQVIVTESVTFAFKVNSWSQFIGLMVKKEEVNEADYADVQEPIPEPTWNFAANDLTLYFQPSGIDSSAVDSGHMFVVPPRAIWNFKDVSLKPLHGGGTVLQIQESTVWLKEDFHYLRNSEIWLDFCHPKLRDHLSSKSLIPVVNFGSFSITYVRKETTEIIVDFQGSSEMENKTVVNVQPDSFETLVKVLSNFAVDLGKEFDSPSSGEAAQPQVQVQAQPVPHPGKEEVPPPQKNINLKKADLPKQRNEQPRQKYVLFDEEAEGIEQPMERNVLEESWEIVDDEIASQQLEQEQEDLVFPPYYQSSTTISLVNIAISVNLLGGHGWDRSNSSDPTSEKDEDKNKIFRKNKALVGKENAVEIQIVVPYLSMNMFANQISDWRLRLHVQRLVVIDRVRKSHHAKVLTFTRQDHPLYASNAKKPVIRLLLEKGRFSKQPVPTSLKLKVVVLPLRLYVDQDTLNFICDFFTFSSSPPKETKPPPNVPASELFEYFEISTIDTVIDYKPKNTIKDVFTDIRLGNHVWAIKVVELSNAPIVLSSIKLTNVKDSQAMFSGMLSQWVKDFKHTQVYNYLWGTKIAQPVQICVNIGAGVVDLVKIPVEEYNKGGNVLKGIGMGATSLVVKLTVEVLNVGASSAIAISKGLKKIDKVITGNTNQGQHISSYANQPESLSEGAKYAASSLVGGISSGVSAISTGKLVYLPSLILRPAIGGFNAISNMTFGILNTIDPSKREQTLEKYKNNENNNNS